MSYYNAYVKSLEDDSDNDDDIGALGSILSWDEDEQGEDIGNGAVASMPAGLRERDNNSAPPDTVQFSLKDGIPQFSFLSSQGMNGTSAGLSQSLDLQRDNNNNKNMTLQFPLQTPISNFHQGNDASIPIGLGHRESNMTANLQQQQQQMMPQSQDNQGLAANFAQLLAQQAGNLLQQQQQQQQVQQQQTQQQQLNQNQQASLGFGVQNVRVQAQNQQQPLSQQQRQPVQLAITSDPNTFLQQLQLAQLQQQFQAAQAQQQTVASAAVNQMTNSLQQIPMQLPRSNVALSTVQASRTRPSKDRSMQPPSKRARVSTSRKKAVPASSSQSVTTGSGPVASTVVSASDTDGEISKALEDMDSSAMFQESTGDEFGGFEDKARVNRDRNREHARNTRLRKKAYLEKLKITVEEVCRERDTLMSERTGAATLLVEMHNTRIEVLMSFLALRSTNEKRRKLWSSILDESCFACVMPVTPYRSFPASEVQVSKCQRTILGIDAMIADTASLHVLFDSLVDRSKYPSDKIEIRYTLVTEEAVVAGNQMMARWVMSTTNATQCGAKMEVAKQGMLCCKFNSAHKITGMELMFDVMAFMLQLKQAAGSDGFAVIPNTVQTCQRSFDKPMVMTLADPPYTIVQTNKLWEDMTGYSSQEVAGKTSCSILQREESKSKALQDMMEEVRFKRSASAVLVNFTKTGSPFRNFLLVYPLSTDSRITHYLALTTHTDSGEVAPKIPAPASLATFRPNGVTLPVPESSIPSAPVKNMVPRLMDPPTLLQGSVPAVGVGVAIGAHGQITLAHGQMPPPNTQLRASLVQQSTPEPNQPAT